MARSSLAQRFTKVVQYIAGPEPRGAAMANVLAGYQERDLDGLEKRPYIGMQGDPTLTFSGPVESPQKFRGGVQMGAQGLSIPVDTAVALPSPNFPSGIPTAAEPDWQALLDDPDGQF
jgi:hypothetical protein